MIDKGLWWKVFFGSLMIVLTIVMSAYSVEGKTYYFDEPNELIHLKECEGPIRVRLSSYLDLRDNEIKIIDCTKLSNYVFTCECHGSKTIEFQVSSNYSNAYNFDVRYYIDYWEIPKRTFDENSTWQERQPTEEEIELDNNLRQELIKGIMLREPKEFLNIRLNMTMGSVILASLIVVIGISMYLVRRFKKNLNSTNEIDATGDVFNYSTKDDDEEFNKKLELLQKMNEK